MATTRADNDPPNRRRLLRWLLRDITLAVLVCSTFGSMGSTFFLFDLCSHFRCQYFVLLAVLAVWLWRIKSPKWAAAALLGVIHNAVLVGPYYLPIAKASDNGPQLSLISFNVHTANRRSADVLAYLQRQDPDLILLIEVNHRWIRELAPLTTRYPHTAISPQADNFGMAVYSKLPIVEQDIASLGPDQPLSVWVKLDVNGRRIGFLGTHPWPPMTADMFQSRNEQLAAAADRAKSSGLPTILAGDFNASPWCSGFRPLMAAGLRDTALGFGVQRTWNSKIPLMRIPIDHVLTTPEFTCLKRTVGLNCGSDHYAVEAELRLK